MVSKFVQSKNPYPIIHPAFYVINMIFWKKKSLYFPRAYTVHLHLLLELNYSMTRLHLQVFKWKATYPYTQRSTSYMLGHGANKGIHSKRRLSKGQITIKDLRALWFKLLNKVNFNKPQKITILIRNNWT